MENFNRIPGLSHIEARKFSKGGWRLFYLGTQKQVFPGEIFKSASQARQYFVSMKLKRKI